MSNGSPMQEPMAARVAYAKGFDPEAEDVWEKSYQAVGGDDFVELLEGTFCRELFALTPPPGKQLYLDIMMDAEGFEIEVRARKG